MLSFGDHQVSLKSCGPVSYSSLDPDHWTPDLGAIKKCEATQVMASRVVYGELAALDLAADKVMKKASRR